MANKKIKIAARPIVGGLFLWSFLAVPLFSATLEISASPLELGLSPKEDLQAIRDKYGLPALGAAVVNTRGLAWSEVLGLRSSQHKVLAKKNDPFHLGSCTKAMTSTLIAMLVEEGKLSWDDTLGELFVDLKGMHPKWKEVSLDQLARHRAGMPSDLARFHGGKLWKTLWESTLSPRQARWQLMQALLRYRPQNKAGGKYEYSNAGYILLGTIAELVENKSWENLLQEKIFKPLKMKTCGFGAAGVEGEKSPSVPWGHKWTFFKIETIPPGLAADNPAALGPAGTVYCSLKSWAAFLAMHLRGEKGIDFEGLSARAIQALHRPVQGETYTRGGWKSIERDWADGPALQHIGSNTMNYANGWMAPKKGLAYIAVTNVGGDRAAKATDAAIKLLVFYGEK